VEIFYYADESGRQFDRAESGHLLKTDNGKKRRNRKFTVSDSGVMTVPVMFHPGHYRDFKAFYTGHVQRYRTSDFPKTVSCNRFGELQQKVPVKMTVLLQLCRPGKSTGISFTDSAPLQACRVRRACRNRTFKGTAAKGKSTVGRFSGFKLHAVINDSGEIVDFLISRAHADDREPLKNKSSHRRMFGKLFGDRGYIPRDLFEKLFVNGIHLITGTGKNMKNSLMLLPDRICLRKRALSKL
jgi:hypothetical protein